MIIRVMKQNIVILFAILLLGLNAFANVDAISAATETVPFRIDTLSQEEIDAIQARGVFVVGYVDDLAPLSYLNQTNHPAGVAVDTISGLAEALDVELKFVQQESGAYFDIALGHDDEVNGLKLTQSAPYYTSAYVLLHNDEASQFSTKPVGSLDYFHLTDDDYDDMLGQHSVIIYESFEEMKEAFLEGDLQSVLLTSVRYNSIHSNLDAISYSVEVLHHSYRCSFYYAPTLDKTIAASLDQLLWQLDSGESVRYSALFHTSNALDMQKETFIEYINENPHIPVIFFFVIIFAVMCSGALVERKHLKKLESILLVDEVTGLATRHRFRLELERVLKEQPNEQYSVFAFDVDNFKYINEIYGYDVGTSVLQKLADRLRTEMGKTIIIARSDADEFLVLMKTKKLDANLVDAAMAKSMTKFTDWTDLLGEDYQFSLSVGYYTITNPNLNSNYMVDCARIARNLGKETVGFTIYEFTSQMERERAGNNHIVATMEAGVREREFVVYYQPKVDLNSERISGAEALVRWKQNGTIIPPNKFIPIFEKNGFIEKLDYYVLGAVCQFIRENENHKLPVISVNLSAVTVMQDDLVTRILTLVERYGVRPNQIDLEITESALVDRFEAAVEKIEQLREAGFTIAMDDFGAGVSSLGRLKSIPLDSLKIDRSFIVDAQRSERGTEIVRHVIQMAQALKLETVAEGIESKDQLRFLKALGCDVGQGYFYARPLPERDFIQMLAYDEQKQ